MLDKKVPVYILLFFEHIIMGDSLWFPPSSLIIHKELGHLKGDVNKMYLGCYFSYLVSRGSRQFDSQLLFGGAEE